MSDLGNAVAHYVAGMIVVAVVVGIAVGGMLVWLVPLAWNFAAAHISFH